MQSGFIEIDGQQYIERFQVFAKEVVVNAALTQDRLVLPGEANFLLKGLTADTFAGGNQTSLRFKFRLGNSDGQKWYMSGGVGATTDRILNTLVLGTGLFPYMLIPPVPYTAGASMLLEIEDFIGEVPYTILFGFHGSYLIPVGAEKAVA